MRNHAAIVVGSVAAILGLTFGGVTAPAQDPVPAPTECVVPGVKGKKLRSAEKALFAAGCSRGAIKGKLLDPRFVVKKQNPRAGSIRPLGFKVLLSMGPKRKKK